MKKTILIILITAFIIPAYAQKSLKKKLDKLDEHFSEFIQEWEVPGMAVAIVKDGEIVFEKATAF